MIIGRNTNIGDRFLYLVQAAKYNDMFRRLSGPAAYQCGRGHPGDLALV